MEITEVGVRIVERSEDRLKAVCTMTIDDCFVVRDIKVVEGQTGLFVAMPSRKKTSRCHQCGHKNEIRSHFCADCGVKQNPAAPRNNHHERSASHTDIAHPINTECREMIQEVILEAYREELAEYLAEQEADGGRETVDAAEPEAEIADDRMSEPSFTAGLDAPYNPPKPREQPREPRADRGPERDAAPPRERDAAPPRERDARPDKPEPRRQESVAAHADDGFASGIF
ncbi:MAG: putative septation protein SpoVG [Phycisphaerae bacterium]|nr:putative septation protein SpoVG [Phycisphaerae bacterium]